MRQYIKNHGTIFLGRVGENQAREIIFDITGLVARYGEGTCNLIHQRSGDDKPYPVAITQTPDSLVWTVKDVDVAKPGCGKCELIYIVDYVVAKSYIYTTVAEESMGEPTEEIPEVGTYWLDNVLQCSSKAEASAKNAKEAEENAKVAESNAKESETEAKAAWEGAVVAVQTAQKGAEEASTSEKNAAKSAEEAKEAAQSVPQTVENALKQAKESGEFDGEPGKDYVLTEEDKKEIAEQAADMVDVPEGGGVKTINGVFPDSNGNVSISPDWNASNGSPGYIKNRTHYEGMIPKLTPIQFSGYWEYEQTYYFTTPINLEVGKKYVVTCDGVSISCTANLNKSSGNVTMHQLSGAYQFIVTQYPEQNGDTFGNYTVYSSQRGVDFTIEEEKIVPHVYKLDEKYLPDSVGKVKTVNGIAPDANGNVDIELPNIPGSVLTVNGQSPDENGNVQIDIPESSGSGITVTAKPGQLIRVKEVDENGNPTAWEAAEDMPWKEPGLHYFVDNMAYTSALDSTFGCFVIRIDYGDRMVFKGIDREKNCSITYDGVTKEHTPFNFDFSAAMGAGMSGTMWGNLGFLAGFGIPGENTGEPYLFVLMTNGFGMLLTTDTQPTTHAVSVAQDGEVVHSLSSDYMGIPCIDFIKLGVDPFVQDFTEIHLDTETMQYIHAACEFGIVRIRFCTDNDGDPIPWHAVGICSVCGWDSWHIVAPFDMYLDKSYHKLVMIVNDDHVKVAMDFF